MDGFPLPKNKTWRGETVSETRYYVNTWLEKELPLISGKIINIGAGGSLTPKKLLDKSKVTKYITFDQKYYGDSKNPVDVIGSVEKMPEEWTNHWDVVICVETLECVSNPFRAMEEIHRILKSKGTLLLTVPFNYRFFGEGTGLPKKKNPVKDYWRFTRDGLLFLAKDFGKVKIEGFGGSGEHDKFVYCMWAMK